MALEYIDCMLRLFDELIKIPPRIVVFSWVDYFACICYFQALCLQQCSLHGNLFFIKCKLTRAFADPVTDVDTVTVAFFLQRLLVSFEPLASWAVICVDSALVLWNELCSFSPGVRVGRIGSIVLSSYLHINLVLEGQSLVSAFQFLNIISTYLSYLAICSRYFLRASIMSGRSYPSW